MKKKKCRAIAQGREAQTLRGRILLTAWFMVKNSV